MSVAHLQKEATVDLTPVGLLLLQFVLTVALTASGISNKVLSDQNEFSACPEFGVINLVWLARTAFVAYLVLWAHRMRSRIGAHMEGRADGVANVRHVKDGSRLESRSTAQSPWDVTVSERAVVIHMR
ncbi:hypothetical protein TRAPUB_12562 [Trametes pubescens]|uniref:Uncharacterized protein n=1 Tax=Trametes pubescens TaxID=154538 RepID=A0A1M2VTK0_TRAPU|nr:hypothetical protein TRAPUB_12562 [Trametes pubescens]